MLAAVALVRLTGTDKPVRVEKPQILPLVLTLKYPTYPCTIPPVNPKCSEKDSCRQKEKRRQKPSSHTNKSNKVLEPP